MNQSILNWLKLRLPLESLDWEHLREKSVPIHRLSWVYYLGGLALLALLVQVVTGILLLLYYKPTVVEANASVEYITRVVPCGLLIRNLHVWSSNAMILLVILHGFTVALTQAYRKPRELTWMTGVASLLVLYVLGFSGYLLPWNNLAVYATKVGTEIMAASTGFLPGVLSKIGPFLASIVLGGSAVGQDTLTRFFALHVVLLPLALAFLVFAHLLMVQLHGMSVPLSVLKKRPAENGVWRGPSERYVPGFLLKESAVWLAFLAALMILSVVLPYDLFVPYTLLAPYDPLASAPAGIRPEWYFWFVYYPLELLPRALVIAGAFAFFAALLAAPWLMAGLPKLWRAKQDSSFPAWAAWIVFLALLAITIGGQALVAFLRGGA